MIESLEEHIKLLIEADGPMDVATYMRLCLTHPTLGYYTNNNPIGQSGDFITAPEVSQLFGEMIGIWVIDIWTKLGEPKPINLVEVGPGRGTLMADILRTCQKLSPGFNKAAKVHLIEVSQSLQKTQKKALQPFNLDKNWHDTLENVEKSPLILIGNEFLDALPIVQFQREKNKFFERVIGLSSERGLNWGLRPTEESFNLEASPETLRFNLKASQEDSGIIEVSPDSQSFIFGLCEKMNKQPSAALFIDYGHLKSTFGATLQSVKNHKPHDPLVAPGTADLTAHVDFEPLTKIAKDAGLAVSTTTQGSFLLAMGLLERAGQLGAQLDEEAREKIRNDVERLAAPDKMGDLFKVMALTPKGITPHGF